MLSVGLDPTWGFGGVAQVGVPPTTDVNGVYTRTSQTYDAIALQGGQVVEVGTRTTEGNATSLDATSLNLIVSRLTADGSADATFGQGGTAVIPLTLGGATYTVQQSSNIDIAVRADGSIDILAIATPSASGSGSTPASSEALVVQLTPNGSLDTSFGTGGGTFVGIHVDATAGVNAPATPLTIEPDGKIVVVGWTTTKEAISGGAYIVSDPLFAIARLDADGSTDTSFGTDGIATVAFKDQSAGVTAAAVQPDGAIVVVGSANIPGYGAPAWGGFPTETAVARLNPDGTLDTSFNGTGTLVFDQDLGGSPSSDVPAAVALSGSQIVIVGGASGISAPTISELTATRLNADGSFDATFDGDGKFFLPLSRGGVTFNSTGASVIVRPGGSLQIGGRFAEQDEGVSSLNPTVPDGGLLLGLTPTGAPDTSLGPNGTALIPNAISGRMLEQADGKVVFLSGGEVDRTTAPSPAVASTTVVLSGAGTKKASGVSVTFDAPVTPALTNIHLYQVRTVKGHKLVKLRRRGIAYDAATRTLTLRFAHKATIRAGFELALRPGAVAAADGEGLPAAPILIPPPAAT